MGHIYTGTKMNKHPEKLASPKDLAKAYGVTSAAVLNWYHSGTIPAEIAEGRVIRFDPDKVAKVLANRAKTNTPEKQPKGKLPTHALVI